MYEKEKSVQAMVKESCPVAVFVHFSAHVLNLVSEKSCAIPEIYSTFNFIADISNFLNLAVKEMHTRLTTAFKSMSDRISNKWSL